MNFTSVSSEHIIHHTGVYQVCGAGVHIIQVCIKCAVQVCTSYRCTHVYIVYVAEHLVTGQDLRVISYNFLGTLCYLIRMLHKYFFILTC